MKVLFFNHNPVGYGTYWRAYNIAKHMSKQNLEITMICASNNAFDTSVKRKKIEDKFELVTLPRFKYGKYMTGQEVRLFISIWQALSYKYDLVHAFTVAQPQIAIPSLIGKHIMKKKMIVDWDDAWHEGFASIHRFPVRNVLSYCELNVPRHADAVTVASNFLYEKTLRIGIDKARISYIPNGCNSDIIEPLDKYSCRKMLELPDCPILLTMGHTYAETMTFLLNSFKIVKERVPDAKLIILSKIELDSKERDFLKIFGTSLIITGEVPAEKLNVYLCAADIFLLPMRNSVIEKARFPIRLGDYMSAARPIISNAVGEVKRIIEAEKCGIATEPDDPQSMAEAVTRLLSSPEEMATMGSNGRCAAEKKLSWPIIADEVAAVYSRVMESR